MVFELFSSKLPLSILIYAEPFTVRAPLDLKRQRRLFERGSLAGIQWLFKYGQLKTPCPVAAAGKGHTDILRWVDRNFPSLDPKIWSSCLTASASGGFVDTARYIHSHHRVHVQEKDIRCAIVQGSQETVEFLLNTYAETCTLSKMTTDRLFTTAAYMGYNDIVVWMDHNGYYTPIALGQVACSGNLDLLRYCIETHGVTSQDEYISINLAAGHGHAHIIDWFLERGNICSYSAISIALDNGYNQLASRMLRARLSTQMEHNSDTAIIEWIPYDYDNGTV